MIIKNCTTLMFLGPNTQKSYPDKENIERSELLILLKKSGGVKSK